MDGERVAFGADAIGSSGVGIGGFFEAEGVGDSVESEGAWVDAEVAGGGGAFAGGDDGVSELWVGERRRGFYGACVSGAEGGGHGTGEVGAAEGGGVGQVQDESGGQRAGGGDADARCVQLDVADLGGDVCAGGGGGGIDGAGVDSCRGLGDALCDAV